MKFHWSEMGIKYHQGHRHCSLVLFSKTKMIFREINTIFFFVCVGGILFFNEKGTSNSHTLNIGQYLVHSQLKELRILQHSNLWHTRGVPAMHPHYGKRYPSHRNASYPFLEGLSSFHCIV